MRLFITKLSGKRKGCLREWETALIFKLLLQNLTLLPGKGERTIETSKTCCIGVSDIDCKLAVVQIIV